MTPYAAVQAQSFRTPGYSETDVTGGGFGLTYNSRTATDTRSELGARFDHVAAFNGNAVLTLRGAARLGARLGHRPGAWPPCSRRFPARASSSTARRPRRIPRSPPPAPSFGSPTASRLLAKFDGEFASHSQHLCRHRHRALGLVAPYRSLRSLG